MEKEVFKENLDRISKLALEIGRKIAWNNLSENIYYIIRPNILADSDHLDNEEKTNLRERKKELRKPLTIDQVLSRLYFSERIPVWINVSIAEAKSYFINKPFNVGTDEVEKIVIPYSVLFKGIDYI